MDSLKAGKLIYDLRKEKNMTQKQVADALHVSDKTISKWERGQGCPDISVLSELSKIFGVNVEKILIGDLTPNTKDNGNLKNTRFYVCSHCGDIITSSGSPEVYCCGRKQEALAVKEQDESHHMNIEDIENDFFITINHEMTKEHYISFMLFLAPNYMQLIKLYPEQNAEVRIPKVYGAKLFCYCTQHGLMKNRILPFFSESS